MVDTKKETEISTEVSANNPTTWRHILEENYLIKEYYS
jgi:hypothetical protein